MIEETLRTEFEALKNDFETIRQQIESDVVRTEWYKGEFYELTPYSYQRNGFRQGKTVKRPDTVKSTKNLCIYGFNNQNQIVEVKVGCSIENQFYHTFLYYTDNLVKSFWETIQKGGYFYEKKKCNKDARGNNNDINAHSRLDRMWWIGQQWQ